jgi:ubiquinone/menaquinone biosynthesis C-methylase UbiE
MFTEYFHSVSVKNYEAIDISEKSVHELSRKYNKYKFTNADISKLEHYNKKYDFIFAADVLLHVTNENNYKATISNISKSLKDHGTCILMDPISVLNTKSESDHVVIRDKNYIENILKNNDLELVQMLPVAFFMNYPFDKELLGNNGETAINLFNLISHIFSNVGLSDKEKEMLCNYLINKERQLLIDKNFGLSEKLIIVKKKSNKDKNNLVRINDIWNKTELVKEEELILKEKNNSISNYLDNLKNLISKFYN